jgi:hypothetical protein
LAIAAKEPALEQVAFAEAMRRYLEQESGQAAIWQDDRVAPLVSQASRYVRRFSYPRQAGAKGLILRVRFDAAAIQQELAARGLPLSRGSDSLIIWLVQGMGDESLLLGQEDASEVYAAAGRYASDSGLKLIVPLMDLGEQAAFRSALDIPAQEQKLLALSNRYGEAPVLIGRFDPVPGGLAVDWRLFGSGEPQAWMDQAMDADTLLATAMSRLGREASANRKPPQTATASRLRLRVIGRGRASDGEIRRYLEGLSLIQSAKSQPGQGETLFTLKVLGNKSDVAALIPLGGLLRPSSQPIKPKKKPRRTGFHDGALSDLQQSGGNRTAPKPQVDTLVVERTP